MLVGIQFGIEIYVIGVFDVGVDECGIGDDFVFVDDVRQFVVWCLWWDGCNLFVGKFGYFQLDFGFYYKWVCIGQVEGCVGDVQGDG